MEGEAAADAEHGPAGVEDQGLALRDRSRNLGDGTIADRDQEQFGVAGQIIDVEARRFEQLGDAAAGLVAKPEARQRPADAFPRRAERPRGPAAPDDA